MQNLREVFTRIKDYTDLRRLRSKIFNSLNLRNLLTKNYD